MFHKGITITDLVACLGIGKGTWGNVAQIMHVETWEHIFLITNDFGKQHFTHEKPFSMTIVDTQKPVAQLKKEIIDDLKDKLSLEVALNMESGTGKEHMALIAALLSLGVGIRFIAVNGQGADEI